MDSPQTTGAYLRLEETGQTFPLEQKLVTIGRKSENTIALTDDMEVSRYHATIAWEDGRYMLQDVGSVNGTYLNQKRLTEPEPLSDGDLIQIGDTTFTVVLPVTDTRPSLKPPPVVETDSTILSTATEPAPDETLAGAGGPAPATAESENPYVGPRTFSQRESDRFFGREREARELRSLVISQRLVLFYAQSGAGKSSLLNARLIPQLRQAGFPVLPVGRVSGELPEGITDVENIFIFNLLLSLDESDGPPAHFSRLKLTDFLTRLTSLDGRHYFYDETAKLEPASEEQFYEEAPYVLIIDQFEEIFTTHPERWPDREGFFQQLEQAMTADPYLWVVLTMREDYVTSLDPYLHLVPDNLRARFYMQRMEYEAALEAIKKPAEKYGRPFAPGVAESLVDNLRQIRIHGEQLPGQVETALGQFVEPVQLQVVCYQLWQNLQGQPLGGEITHQDLRELGDVDEALAQFYEQAVAEVVEQTGVSEVELRNWFETELITEADTRGTVYRGAEQTGGLPNEAVDLLVNKFLLRAEVRTGGTWYELVHDRFVDPILQANRAWGTQQPLIQMAQAWADSDRSPNRLLEGQLLKEALDSNWQALGPLVEEFITASRETERVKERARAAEKEAQRQRELAQARALAEEQEKRASEQAEAATRLRRRAILATGLALAALLMACTAGWFSFQAQENALEAEIAKETAQAESTAAAANAAEVRKFLESQNATQTAVLSAENSTEEEEDLSTRMAYLAATLTAQPSPTHTPSPTATATPSPTPIPTYTPAGQATPPPDATPTNTPTATATPTSTATPTPNKAATATIEAIQIEIAVVQQEIEKATRTAELPLSRCAPPEGAFEEIWEEFKDRLGCPTQPNPIGGQFAEQAYQNGRMFWSQILDEFIILVGEKSGSWQLLTMEEVESTSCPEEEPPSPELVMPVRGFGSIWCEQEAIRRQIGWATEQEYGTVGVLLQKFENGLILQASDGSTYVLFGQKSGKYIQTR